MVGEKAGEGGFDESMKRRARYVGRRWLEIERKVQFENKVGIGLGGSGRVPRRERGGMVQQCLMRNRALGIKTASRGWRSGVRGAGLPRS